MLSNKLAIATWLSLGQHPSHSLANKIWVAAKVGLTLNWTRSPNVKKSSITEGAKETRVLCQENFEGDRSPLDDRLEKATHWIKAAEALHVKKLTIFVCLRIDAIGARGMRETATRIDRIRVSWGTHCLTGNGALQYVKQVDRSNSTVSMKPRKFEVIFRLSQVGSRTRKELHRPRSRV
ncbi:hypothetical protein N7494_003794 [Penicillium frequentans]|uniref:Uncharacterized protein n=1 Tax=Penicillium frequentans TaxID=3151616 RepID=A0AAD6GI28_9EURO|nr:hypothetical protein N7494_003794 [Penicillium glabrum]